jgi:hypothetical protein
MQKDYWDGMKSMKDDMNRQFGSSKRQTLTKELLKNLRFGRKIDSTMPNVNEEYGDYEKFEDGKNEVKEVNERGLNDVGYDMFERNYKEMFRQLDESDPKRETEELQGEEEDLIRDTILNKNIETHSLLDEYNNQHPRFNLKHQDYEHALMVDEMKNHEHTATPL